MMKARIIPIRDLAEAEKEVAAFTEEFGDKLVKNGLATFTDKIVIWYDDSEPGDSQQVVGTLKSMIEREALDLVSHKSEVSFWKEQNDRLVAQKNKADDKDLMIINSHLTGAQKAEEQSQLRVNHYRMLLSKAENGEFYV